MGSPIGGSVVYTCHYDDSNEKIGEDEVAEEKERNGKELAATKPV